MLFKIRKMSRLLKPVYEGQGLLGRKNVTISGTIILTELGTKLIESEPLPCQFYMPITHISWLDIQWCCKIRERA